MDIKQLKFLIALDETRHFGQAAARCHITQPTLSMRLRNLEEELDLPLVNRGQRFEGFTAPGERVLAWARSVMAAYDGLHAEAAACRGNLIGTLRLGCGAAVELRSAAIAATPARRAPEPAL
jgi:DNA-binding transcriptional LysR family regulator